MHSVGIYHGLPEFYAVSQTAIVTGANGVSGQTMLKILLAHPERWTTIYAVSRGPPLKNGTSGKKVHHIAVDFLDDVKEVVNVLMENHIKYGYCFYFSYMESADPGVMYAENGDMLETLLNALYIANAIPKRVVLQTGGKHYASIKDHTEFRRRKMACEQEDTLQELGSKYRFDYAITRPITIIGTLKGNFLNLAIAVGLHLSITKELGEAPDFNGTLAKYHSTEALSSSTMNGYFTEWCALTPECSNEAFNITNGDISTWARLFPELCTFFKHPPPSTSQFTKPAPRPFKSQFLTVRPLDYVKPSNIELLNSWDKWAKEERTLAAWKKLQEREGLGEDAFQRASWGYADHNMAIDYNKLESMSKARNFGWLGYVDSTENFLEVLREAQGLGILPKFEVDLVLGRS